MNLLIRPTKARWANAIAVLLVLLLTALPAVAQSDASPTKKWRDGYDEALEILFPRSLDRTGSRFQITVRYQPAFGREAQVTIRRDIDGRDEIQYWRVPEKDKSVWARYHQATEKSGLPDPKAFARQIRIEKSKVKLPKDDIEKILDRFTRIKLDFDLSEPAFIHDGMGYDIWFESGLNELHWSTNVAGYKNRSEIPVVEWADGLLAAAQKAVGK